MNDPIEKPSMSEIIDNAIIERLKLYDWNRTHAALSLHLSPRTVVNHIKKMKAKGAIIPDGKPGGWWKSKTCQTK